MRWRRFARMAILLLGLLQVTALSAAAGEEPVRRAVYEFTAEQPPEVVVRGVWGSAITSLPFAQRVYWLSPVQDYAGLDPEACRLVDEWVSLANRWIREYREAQDDSYLKLGPLARELTPLVLRKSVPGKYPAAAPSETWEVRLERVEFSLNPAACRYFLVVRRTGS